MIPVVLVAVVLLLIGGVTAGVVRLRASVLPPGRTAAAVAPTPYVAPTPFAVETPVPTPDDAGVLAAVQGHWDAIRQHRFTDAYAYLGPDIMAAQPEPQWISSHEQDGISDVAYDFRVVDVSGDSAVVEVVRLQTTAISAQTPGDPSGCLVWSGTYGLVRLGGRWLVDQVHITSTLC